MTFGVRVLVIWFQDDEGELLKIYYDIKFKTYIIIGGPMYLKFFRFCFPILGFTEKTYMFDLGLMYFK